MKNKFNLKLTLLLVSLFIGLLIIILGNKNRYCLFFGFLLIACTLPFFAKMQTDKINKVLQATQKEIEQEQPEQEVLNAVYSEMSKLRKQKKSTTISFNVFAVLLAFVSFFFLF